LQHGQSTDKKSKEPKNYHHLGGKAERAAKELVSGFPQLSKHLVQVHFRDNNRMKTPNGHSPKFNAPVKKYLFLHSR